MSGFPVVAVEVIGASIERLRGGSHRSLPDQRRGIRKVPGKSRTTPLPVEDNPGYLRSTWRSHKWNINPLSWLLCRAMLVASPVTDRVSILSGAFPYRMERFGLCIRPVDCILGVKTMKKLLILVAVAASLGACTQREQNTGMGALIGAGTGALIGGLATGRAGGALAGAAIGG